MAIFSVAALMRLKYFVMILCVIPIVCIVGVGYYTAWLSNRTREFITMENQLLRLTRHPRRSHSVVPGGSHKGASPSTVIA